MWSQIKNLISDKWQAQKFLLLATLFLTACGFQPMYGDNSALSANTPLAGNLVIDDIGGREGQMFKIALEDRLNPEGIKSANPEYRLQIKLIKTSIPAIVKNDGTIQRYNVQIVSAFTLIKTAGNKPLLSGDTRRTSGYTVVTNATFATYEAEQAVIARILQEMAEDYVLRLAGYFAGQK